MQHTDEKNGRFAALRAAFPHAIPVLAGYTFLGIAYGILAQSKGIPLFIILLMSLLIFSGSMQFVAVSLLTAAFDPIAAFLVALAVNARYLFYGVSMLEEFRGMGAAKFYLIFGMTDETFAIISATPAPKSIARKPFIFWITFLDQLYWVCGSLLGALAGSLFPFDTTGIDFVMTALFMAIFVEQWQGGRGRLAAVVGVVCALACLLIFGAENFMIPAMASILLVLSFLRNPLERREKEAAQKEGVA